MTTKTLFNDATLSDVKIIQVYEGKSREYHAHKVALCVQSAYFMTAFTGGFKEASEAVITIEDDDPVHFEFALKFMYTLHYDTGAIEAIVGKGKSLERIQFTMGMFKIADKYDIKQLTRPVSDDIKFCLEKLGASGAPIKTLVAAARAIYESTPGCTRHIGRMIMQTLLKCVSFTISQDFNELCASHPGFAADAMAFLKRLDCETCNKTIFYNESDVRQKGASYDVWCPYCGCLN